MHNACGWQLLRQWNLVGLEHYSSLSARVAILILNTTALCQAQHLLIAYLHAALDLLRKLFESIDEIVSRVCMVYLCELRHQRRLLRLTSLADPR